jgi:hypothetical protein
MKTILTFGLMLIVAPLVAATTPVCWQPGCWGGSMNPLGIVGIALFGVLSVPLWPTYIPSLIITPIVMKRLSTSRAFLELPLPIFPGVSVLIGALSGCCVIFPLVLGTSRDSTGSDLVLNWLAAGAASGAVTLTLVALIYRLLGPGQQPGAAPNEEAATPAGHPECRRDRHP